MRDILSRITKWWEAGDTFGLATVVRTYRSAPRDPGAALAVSSSTDHEVVGSVSGGCVEGAVYELSLDVCQTGEPVLVTYGVSDDDAFAVGLTCGGIIDIFVERVDQASRMNDQRDPTKIEKTFVPPHARACAARKNKGSDLAAAFHNRRTILRPDPRLAQTNGCFLS